MTTLVPILRYKEEVVLHRLHHYLPHQNPLKDFIHHNTLHAFQDLPFHKALETASTIFGYQTYLHLSQYRKLFSEGKINPKILKKILLEKKGSDWQIWQEKLLHTSYNTNITNRLGQLHQIWTKEYHLNIEKEIHSFLFRFVGAFIDQGISLQKFPVSNRSFLAAVRELERHSFVKIFQSRRVRDLLLHHHLDTKKLLDILVGDEQYYEQYLFDQQFAHAGWSGMVAVIEKHPESLLDRRKISLKDFIIFELLLEIDALDQKMGEANWKNLKYFIENDPETQIQLLFAPVEHSELFEVYALWQEAYEWTLYDQVLKGLQISPIATPTEKKFQAVFCIDDRSCSIRRYVENFGNAETFGTAGFFNFEFYFQPEHGKFYTKSCPAPTNPKYLIKETEIRRHHHQRDTHFGKHSKNLLSGWLISQTMGFWSAIQLAWNIFKPSETPALVSSFRHMDKYSKLSIECKDEHHHTKDHLQIGFTLQEMAERLEGLLQSIGLTKDFAELVYFVGHGASSVNNTHYAGYDCGACSGRAGSVNARVAAAVANKPEVRAILAQKGIFIPETTQFIGALHDTTRDEIDFYDEHILSEKNKILHQENKQHFAKALAYNAKERSRRFLLIDSKQQVEKVHQQVKLRALSLFEPRPEWNHATNALCIVGKRANNKYLFLDRRSFLNSYDYQQDLDGKYLLDILNAVAPVCGGINLEYYFSKVDNHRLGAGSKLPHNVIGLIGVANGLEGDLRTGLPAQMLNIHDTLRLLVVVEHFPEVVLEVVQKNKATYSWFVGQWVHLAVIHPESKELFYFREGKFEPYQTVTETLPTFTDLEELLQKFEKTAENLPICVLNPYRL
jgi:uncharacterized protein YbcC (UPF0753/DUF2309 family)